jgi:hypothetical protein
MPEVKEVSVISSHLDVVSMRPQTLFVHVYGFQTQPARVSEKTDFRRVFQSSAPHQDTFTGTFYPRPGRSSDIRIDHGLRMLAFG